MSDAEYINHDRLSIVGVNLCGSNINATYPRYEASPTLLSVLLYYTDTAIVSASECNLLFESNILSGWKYSDIVKNLTDNMERMPLTPIRDFAVYLSQQLFNVHINITISPMFPISPG